MYSEEVSFYIEYWFDVQLNKLDKSVADNIMHQIGKSIRSLPKKNSSSQLIGGVCLIKEPVYFMIEYMNEHNYDTLLLNLTITDVDTYLDLMNLSKTIKNDSKKIKRRRRNTIKVDNKK